MENYTLSESSSLTQEQYNALSRAYLNKVYAWMGVTMLITAVTAVYAATSVETLTWVMKNQWLVYIGSFAIIMAMCFLARRLTVGALTALLLVFAVMEGFLFGPILTMFTTESLGLTFACTAGMFGAMSIFGAVTKINMSSWGRGLTMIAFGLIIALIANIFFGNGLIDLVLSGIGIVLFSILTAYDTQKLLAEGMCPDEEVRKKGAILGALTLYLDFINLFLFLLRFTGVGSSDD